MCQYQAKTLYRPVLKPRSAELLSPEGGVRNSVGREPYVTDDKKSRTPKGCRPLIAPLRGATISHAPDVGLTPYAIADTLSGLRSSAESGVSEQV